MTTEPACEVASRIETCFRDSITILQKIVVQVDVYDNCRKCICGLIYCSSQEKKRPDGYFRADQNQMETPQASSMQIYFSRRAVCFPRLLALCAISIFLTNSACFIAAASGQSTVERVVTEERVVTGERVVLTPDAASGAVKAGQGIMAGEVTASSVVVQLRLTKTDSLVDGDIAGVAGVVKFSLVAEGVQGPPQVETIRADLAADYLARVQFLDLTPDTKYLCTTQIGTTERALRDGPAVAFKTLPGQERSTAVKFVVVTGMNYARFYGTEQNNAAGETPASNKRKKRKPYAGPDKHLGYPALETILKLKPDFFVGTGDNVYYDTPKEPRAETIAQMRQKWHEQFSQPRFRNLFAAVPSFWMVDDHDFRVDDCDNSGDYLPSPKVAKKILLEQLPYGPTSVEELKTYRTVRVNKDLQIWFTENRLFRSPNKLPDGPGKTIWGSEQKAWLKQTLIDSDARFKILISPTPMVGPDDLRKKDNHCNFGGFRHERDEFFRFLNENGLNQQNFFIVCGDRHWQYHAIDPSGVEEFSCGALVDANSRLGRNPGDPASTDPKGVIQQPYTQAKSSGGFLLIRVEPAGNSDSARLSFEFFEEKGLLLHACIK